jgi:hypothetical protein
MSESKIEMLEIMFLMGMGIASWLSAGLFFLVLTWLKE